MGINYSWVQIKMLILTTCAQPWSAEDCLQALLCAHTPAAVWNHAGESLASHKWMYHLWATQSAQVCMTTYIRLSQPHSGSHVNLLLTQDSSLENITQLFVGDVCLTAYQIGSPQKNNSCFPPISLNNSSIKLFLYSTFHTIKCSTKC